MYLVDSNERLIDLIDKRERERIDSYETEFIYPICISYSMNLYKYPQAIQLSL